MVLAKGFLTWAIKQPPSNTLENISKSIATPIAL